MTDHIQGKVRLGSMLKKSMVGGILMVVIHQG
jgi:hypothetical protein